MSAATDQDDLPAILARAFVQAWQSYYVAGRREAISEEIARPALAKHLVVMAKEGVSEEATLAAAGLQLLNSLTTEPPGSGISRPQGESADGPSDQLMTMPSLHFRFDGLRARFLPQWHVGASRSSGAARNRNAA